MSTPGSEQAYVIVGASLAGAKAAETLRSEGFTGRVVLIGEEDERPYERPPLSKEYLLGKAEREKVFVHAPGWYDEHDVELRLGTRATAIDRAAHEVELAGGERVPYDKLLLTTGSAVRRLPLPGGNADGVLYLRRLEDSERISAAIGPGEGRHVVVIGGGWIGLEVAAAAKQRGADVTLIEVLDLPLQQVLGDELAVVFADLHRDHGVDLRLRTKTREIRAAGDRWTVVLDDGTELTADAVVVGVGIAPATELAETAGLDVDNGVLVDAALRTSDPDIYAAGDVANAHNPVFGERVRVEHWANALNGGPAAARSMLGQQVGYDRVPYFYSDQYDLGMEYSGLAGPGRYDQVVYRGDVAKREFISFWLADGRVLAGMNVNVWDVTGAIQDLVRSGRKVDTDRLADPSVPLAEV